MRHASGLPKAEVSASLDSAVLYWVRVFEDQFLKMERCILCTVLKDKQVTTSLDCDILE